MSLTFELKRIILLILIPITFQLDSSKMLIIYFTRTGNTEKIANYINKATNIELFKIEPKTAYPSNYDETLSIVRNEQSSNSRPEINNPLTDVSKYDIILLGHPIWYSHLPNIVMTQLELLNLNNKIIYPFNTHEGSGIGSSVNDIKNIVSGATVNNGFPIQKSNVENSEDDVNEWLENIGIDIVNDATINGKYIKFFSFTYFLFSLIF
jgi:flavodoxin